MSAAAPPGPPGSSLEGERLESWKEIAAYLGRTVRTVQRWERLESLPVHRLRHDRQGSVYALRSELDAWWRSRQAQPRPDAPPSDPADGTPSRSRRDARPRGRALALVAALGTLSLPWWPSPPAPAPLPRVAVLAVDALDPDPRLERFAAGLTEELITELARLDGLLVFSRSSILALESRPPGVEELREKLGASHLVEGSVRREDDRLRVTARLVRTKDQATLWSDASSLPAGELPRLQRELALRVAASLTSEAPRGHGADPPSLSPEAYEAFLNGRELLKARTSAGFVAAEQSLLEATRLAPRFARAWSALADCYALMGNYGTRPVTETHPAAERAVARALELDPELGEAWAARAFMRRNHDWDFAGADADFRRALELSPGDVQAWSWYALHLSTLGRFDEAATALERARELDPLNPTRLHQLAALSLNARHWPEAIRRFRALLELDPDDVNAHLDLGRALARVGEWDEAIAELRRSVELSGEDPMAVAVLGHVLARAGRGDEAREQLARLDAASATRHVSPYLRAVLLAGLGEREAAVDQLEAVVAERHVGALSMGIEPELDGLRGEPRFQALLGRIGAPPAP